MPATINTREDDVRPTWVCPTCGSENRWGVSFCEGWSGVERHPIVFLSALYANALDALRNAAGLLDTPVGRRTYGKNTFYAEVVGSIRSSLPKSTP